MYSNIKICGEEYRFRLTLKHLKLVGGFEVFQSDKAEEKKEQLLYLGLKDSNENFMSEKEFEKKYGEASLKEGIQIEKAIQDQLEWDYPGKKVGKSK